MKNESLQFTPEMFKLFAEFAASRMGGSKVTFRDLWAKYAEYGSSRTDSGKPRIKGWRVNATLGKSLLLAFGDLPWDEVNLAAADTYRRNRAEMKSKRTGSLVKAATRNREMRTAQACLSFAVKKGIIPRNPLSGMQDEPTVHDRDFALNQDQVAKLMRAARPQLRWFLAILNETGMRRGELLSMEWTEVDLNRGLMTVLAHKAKAGMRRDFPLTENARAVLEMIPQDGCNPYVFANPSGGRDPLRAPTHVAEGTLTDWWQEARDIAGVKGPKGQPVWLHTLRHTFATDMATAGMPMEVLMNICGWTTEKMARRYINIAPSHRDAVRPLMEARGAQVRDSIIGEAVKPKRAPRPIVEVDAEEAEALKVVGGIK